MANLLDLAQKMGISTTPEGVERKANTLSKRRPWLEEEKEPEIFKGELKKNTSQEKLKKEDGRLEKIENKTSRLLDKSEQKAPTGEARPHKLSTNSPQTSNKIKREASFYTYICMPPRKLPRKILDHVKANAWPENGDWYSRIDSYELSQMAEINAHQIGNTVRQLRNEGFFEIIEHSTSGYRLLKINPLIFGIKER